MIRDSFTHLSLLNDKSGSCAVAALIVENICYIANVGDSRCLISMNKGKDIRVLTTDHKPNEEHESMRIISNGGKIYQTQTPTKLLTATSDQNTPNQILLGPYRVLPGRLSVSRTIGDAEAKLPEFGGLHGVVIAQPEITYFCIDDEIDFLMMGCDGIFDQLSNEDISDCIWQTCNIYKMKEEDIEEYEVHNVHQQCMTGVDMIMKSSLMRKTLDNVTVVLVGFKNFEREINRRLLFSNNININDSYEAERLATEPSYNYQHEKVKLRSGLKQSKGQSKERKLSPSMANQGKKKNVDNSRIVFSPKTKGTVNFFKKK